MREETKERIDQIKQVTQDVIRLMSKSLDTFESHFPNTVTQENYVVFDFSFTSLAGNKYKAGFKVALLYLNDDTLMTDVIFETAIKSLKAQIENEVYDRI